MAARGFGEELSSFELAVCSNQGTLFQECQWDFHCDALDFITRFMNSEIAADMDKPVSMFHNTGIKQIGESLLTTVSIKEVSKPLLSDSMLYWVGYAYRYWSWLLETPSREIIQITPAEKACILYPSYHMLDVQEAIRLFIKA